MSSGGRGVVGKKERPRRPGFPPDTLATGGPFSGDSGIRVHPSPRSAGLPHAETPRNQEAPDSRQDRVGIHSKYRIYFYQFL